jgi:hypothetical protein
MTQLTDLVSLYRKLERPAIETDFSFKVQSWLLDENLADLLGSILKNQAKSGAMIEILLNKKRLIQEDDATLLIQSIGTTVEKIAVSLPRKGEEQFYSSVLDLIKRSTSIHSGVLPDYFYVIDLDYFKGGTQAHQMPSEINKIEHFCAFISLIQKVCQFVDTSIDAQYKAVFYVTDENSKETRPKKINLSFTSD